jgi:hypothetical protein
MEIFEQFGITQRMLEAFVLFSIAAVVVAVFWRLIAIGCAGLFIVFVFANHQTMAKDQTPVPVETAAQQRFKNYHKDFMEDCMTIAENTKDQCEDIWNDRELKEEKIEKDNVKDGV